MQIADTILAAVKLHHEVGSCTVSFVIDDWSYFVMSVVPSCCGSMSTIVRFQA